MKIVHEDLWESIRPSGTIFIVTTNATIRQDGALVMGRGAAREAVLRYGVQYQFEAGRKISECLKKNQERHESGVEEYDRYPYNKFYYGYINTGVQFTNHAQAEATGVLQVKYNWYENSDLKLIERSVMCLARNAEGNQKWNYRMNFPGIGNGKLSDTDVLPLLKILPDNVTVCRK